MYVPNRNPSSYRKESSSDNPVQNAGAAPLGAAAKSVCPMIVRSVEISFG